MYHNLLLSHAKAKKPAIKKLSSTLKSFNVEFQPFVDEINNKEGDISKYAGVATMQRIKGMILHIILDAISLTRACLQTSSATFRKLRRN